MAFYLFTILSCGSEGLAEGKMDDARAMLADGLSIEKVAQYTGLSKDVIEALDSNS